MTTTSIAKLSRFHTAFLTFLATSCLAAAPLAHAAEQDSVAVQLSARKVVMAEKKEALEPAEKARPNDTIQYDAVYRNTTSGGIKNLAATVPVPAGLAFLADSAKPAGALASLDGKMFSAIPLMREIKRADGTVEKQAVPFAEYRAVRWSIEQLDAGKSTTVSLRARVLAK